MPPAPDPAQSRGTEAPKRLNLNLPPDRFSRVQDLAKRRGTTITDLVRSALGLMERIETEVNEGRRIAVVDSRDQIVKEFVFPL